MRPHRLLSMVDVMISPGFSGYSRTAAAYGMLPSHFMMENFEGVSGRPIATLDDIDGNWDLVEAANGRWPSEHNNTGGTIVWEVRGVISSG